MPFLSLLYDISAHYVCKSLLLAFDEVFRWLLVDVNLFSDDIAILVF